MRIIVTGWRHATATTHGHIILNALRETVGDQPGPHTLVHGGTKGVDLIAAYYAHQLGWLVEPHPADWDASCTADCHHRPTGRRCPVAGPRRNRHMVSLGADACVALPGPGSKGTAGCAALARKAGIRTVEYPLGDAHA